MARARSSVKGTASLRRTLRRLPDDSRDKIADAMEASGRRLLAQAKAQAPSRTGRLRAALSMRVARKTLMLRIGLLTRALRRDLFYGYILEAGRKAKTVRITSGPRRGATMRIKPISPRRYDFVFRQRRAFASSELPRIRTALEQALRDAVKGGGSD